MIGKIVLADKITGFRQILLAGLVVCLLAGCQISPKWAVYEGKPGGLYPGEHWQKAQRPEQLGWSSEKLARARVYSEQIGSAAVMIIDDGVVVDAWGDITRRFQCHSMRKSLMSALIGVHVDKGNMDLSKTMKDLGIDRVEPSLTAEENNATIGDLIRARSGIYIPALGESPDMRAMRPERHSHPPGSFWYYNNWDFNALGTIFERETGKDIFKEFETCFAGPLQMEDFDVSHCRYLNSADYPNSPYSPHRYYLFRVSARDLARFGLLFLREGQWRNRQIVSSGWVKESTASHSTRGFGGDYGYMWWTGVNKGLLPNVNVKAHSYFAAGWGGHRVFVLPYRKLVVVHRVDTDQPGERPMDHHIGRLLWLILSAADETQIGDDPSIEAAKGVRLSTKELKKLLANDNKWIGSNIALFPGADLLILSCSKDGQLTLSATDKLDFKGKWWVSNDRFYFNILGIKAYFTIFQERDTLGLYDPTGTLYGRFKINGS
jgi:CubicO group peptidase (beta-lactamase class C family)